MAIQGINFVIAYNSGGFLAEFTLLEGPGHKSAPKSAAAGHSVSWTKLGAGGENLRPGKDIMLHLQAVAGASRNSNEYEYDPSTNQGLIVHVGGGTYNITWDETVGTLPSDMRK